MLKNFLQKILLGQVKKKSKECFNRGNWTKLKRHLRLAICAPAYGLWQMGLSIILARVVL